MTLEIPILIPQVVALAATTIAGVVGTMYGTQVQGSRQGLHRLNKTGWLMVGLVVIGGATGTWLKLHEASKREQTIARRNLRRQLACIPLYRAIARHTSDLWLTAHQMGLDLPLLPPQGTDELMALKESRFVEAAYDQEPANVVLPLGPSAYDELSASYQAIQEAVRDILTTRTDDFQPHELRVFVELQRYHRAFPYSRTHFFNRLPREPGESPDLYLDRCTYHRHLRLLAEARTVAEKTFTMTSPLIQDHRLDSLRLKRGMMIEDFERQFWERTGAQER